MAELIAAWQAAKMNLPLLVSPDECEGKTYIVTGSNIGLGLESVKNLVRQRPKRVIMAVRSLERGELARQQVEAETGVKDVAEVWHLDLSSYASIKSFSKRVSGLDRVDGVLQNAVAATVEWTVTEGWESGITVNIMGTMMLTVLLMPYLQECSQRLGTKPVISIVGSGMGFMVEHQRKRLDTKHNFEDFNNRDKFPLNNTDRYSMSKLLLLLAVRHLAEIAPTERTGVILNLVDPGPCRDTGLTRYSNWTTKMQIKLLYSVISRSAEMAAGRYCTHLSQDRKVMVVISSIAKSTGKRNTNPRYLKEN